MRLLIDINVLLDVPLGRPGAAASGRVLGTCGGPHEGWLAWHSVATLAYLVARQSSVPGAAPLAPREFIRSLLSWANVAATTKADALVALDLPMADFEDALQAAAAMACGAQFIVTRNGRDFQASPVPAISPEAFLVRFGAG